jgi:hypothetical protein
MVGLDQDLMQNLSCATIGEAQRTCLLSPEYLSNQYLLLSVGALLYIYAAKRN